MKPRLSVACLFALLCSLPALAAEPAKVTLADRWYSLIISGQPAGWMHSLATQQGERIESLDETKIAMRRGGLTIEIELTQRFVETDKGQPVEASSVTKMGVMKQSQTLRFNADGSAELTSEQAGQAQKLALTKADMGAAWLPPMASHRYVQEQVGKQAKEFRFRTVNLGLGPKPIEERVVVLGPEKVEVMGKVVPALAWNATVQGITAKEYVDEHAELLRSSTAALGLQMDVIAADRQLAQAQVNPPELLAASLIKPDKAIDRPRAVRSAVYELHVAPAPATPGAGAGPEAIPGAEKKENALGLPRTGYQRVAWGDQQTARVVVDVGEPVNPGQDLPTDAHRRSTPMLNTSDPKVRELADQALKGQADASAPATAEALRRFVHQFITAKDLSVGFASASEVARTAEGDCTEHAVLLGALLRVKGIPSRVVTGVIYVDRFAGQSQVFGYHMWTQAWLPAGGAGGSGGTPGAGASPAGGRWVDLDATLDGQAFDAAHIALGVSALTEEGMVNDLLQMLPVMGRLSIKVVSVSAGK